MKIVEKALVILWVVVGLGIYAYAAYLKIGWPSLVITFALVARTIHVGYIDSHRRKI